MDTVMFHDIRREHFDLPLDRFRLTFDDGLYSHYYYYPCFENRAGCLTFFVPTAFIREGAARPVFSGRFRDYQKSAAYAAAAFIGGDWSCFMTHEEVQILASRPNVRIGAHSHWHDIILTEVHPTKPKPASPWRLQRFAHIPAAVLETMSIRSRLAFQGHEFRDGRLVTRSEAQWEDYIKRDTEACLAWFDRHLQRVPSAYGFPFNEYCPKLIEILKSFGFEEFYAGSAVSHPEVIGRVDVDKLSAERAGPAAQT